MLKPIRTAWRTARRTGAQWLRAGTLLLGGALALGQSAQANFVNGGFDTDLSGWNQAIYSNTGITTFPPTQRSHLNLQTANPSYPNALTMVASGADANTGGALQVPRAGSGTRSARVNGPLENNRTSGIRQTITVGAGDVSPDGNVHVRFLMAPVLQNPSHSNFEQPYFYVQLTNVSNGNAVLFTQFNFANQPGVNWQTYGGGAGSVQFTDWVTMDIPLPPGQVNPGNQIQLEIIAAGCSLGGHWGYVYVDDVTTGPVPGLSVTASGPSGIVLNPGAPYSTITYTYTYTNNSPVATTGTVVNAVLPMTGNNVSTTFNAVNPNGGVCTNPGAGNTGAVSCNFGTLLPGATGTFTVTVNVPPTASTTAPTNVVNHGNYNISATNVTPLTGPLVVTNVYANGVVLTANKTGAGTGTVSTVPGGINCGVACTTANMTVAPNTPVTLTAAPAVGSTFVGWTGGGCSGTGTCTVPMSASTTVTANFAPVTYPLTVTTTGPGTVASSPGTISCTAAACNESFNHGTLVTLTATPQAGQAFTGWTGCASNPTPTTCTVTMDQARNVTASFVPTFPLNVTTNGPGSVTTNVGGVNCGATCSANFNSGTSVTLTANVPAGSAFTGWSGPGGCSGTATTCTVTMDQARNVTATFVPTYVVTPSVTGSGGTMTPNTPSTVNAGTQVSYTLNPTPGYKPQVGGTCGGVLSGNTFTTSAVTANCTVVVSFSLIAINPVPTLSQWALMLMAALLALLAVGQMPGRNRS